MWQGLLAAPIVIVLLVALLPVLVLWYVARLVRGSWLRSRILLTWPKGKIALVAYTDNRKWAPYIQQEILPAIERSCVVVDRFHAQWKERFPLEAQLINHWGGHFSYNPIAIVFPPLGRPRVFRLYKPFQEMRRGRPEQLHAIARDLQTCVQRCAEQVT
jgi:hypothetical protein